MLIRSGFRAQMEQEIKTAQDYGEIVFYSLSNAVTHDSAREGQERSSLVQVASEVRIEGLNRTIEFGLLDPEQNCLISTHQVSLDKRLLSELGAGEGGWCLQENGGRIYIQVMRPVTYLGSLYYIETVHEVTHVFVMQQSQYAGMVRIMAAMLLFAGLLTSVLSRLLLRRITALTQTTARLSRGELGERAEVTGDDEITSLSRSFNQMADSLEEKIHQLEEEARSRELFVGSFSHELKTPMTSIIGYSDLLRSRELDTQQRFICANYIFQEGKRLEKLSMRLLELIVLKQHVLKARPVSIQSVLEEITALLTPQLSDAGILLCCDVEPGVIPMEPELMKTVLINLIDNARKATEGGGKIVVTGRRNGDNYVLSVQDSGRGMPQQEIPRITDAFYMGDKFRSRRQGGTGLGLAICSEIIALHDFTLSFDSRVGVGTVATITMGEAAG